MEITDLPDPKEKVELIKKNWWVYVLMAAVSVATHLIDGYGPAKEIKDANDRITQLTKTIDSTNRANAIYNEAQNKILLDQILKKDK